MSVSLSVNINKIATLRNSRGGNNPDPIKWALEIEQFGADGITVHPRPDERHIRYTDVQALAPILSKEFNIEGNPVVGKFVQLVLDTKPTQVTLVPDAEDQLTSNHGWDTMKHAQFLRDISSVFKKEGIRVSIFVDPVEDMVRAAADCGVDRVELYTEAYAKNFHQDKAKAIAPYIQAAQAAHEVGLELNAGHDLDLDNLSYFSSNIPNLKEVSIGHALIADALRYGMQNTVALYQRALNKYYHNP